MQRVSTRLRHATKRTIPVVIYANDSFNRANGTLTTADSGQTYLFTGTGSSAWVVSSNQLAPNAPADGSTCYVNLGAGRADHSSQATLAINGGEQAGLIIRRVDDANYYLLNVAATGAYTLYKKVGGAFTSLGTAGAGTLSTTAPTVVALSAKGSTITVTVGGVARTTVTDSALPSGLGVGFRHGSGTTSYRWDDWTVAPS